MCVLDDNCLIEVCNALEKPESKFCPKELENLNFGGQALDSNIKEASHFFFFLWPEVASLNE